MASKKKVIAGNWKMFKTGEEARATIQELKAAVEGTKERVLLAVPFTAITPSSEEAKGSNIEIGAQNMNDASEGAFTGEIAAGMLKEAGATFVILGHSERRHVFGEDDAFINRKVLKALQEGLTPIFCVGETLEEREGGKTEAVLKNQLEAGLKEVAKTAAKDLIVAYEPVWAIGTGKTATPEDAEKNHQFVRGVLEALLGKKGGGSLPILYGGSVKPGNAANLLSQKNIDGVLVGGASLKAEEFAQIVKYNEKAKV